MINDEIKEILDYLQESSKKDEATKQLVDYITNLQQKEELFEKIVYKYDELKQENERLKETNVYCNRTDCVGRIKDSKKYDSVYQEKEDYKSRIEKAVEYIKEQYKWIEESDKRWQPVLDNKKLLNILNGER